MLVLPFKGLNFTLKHQKYPELFGLGVGIINTLIIEDFQTTDDPSCETLSIVVNDCMDFLINDLKKYNKLLKKIKLC